MADVDGELLFLLDRRSTIPVCPRFPPSIALVLAYSPDLGPPPLQPAMARIAADGHLQRETFSFLHFSSVENSTPIDSSASPSSNQVLVHLRFNRDVKEGRSA